MIKQAEHMGLTGVAITGSLTKRYLLARGST
jgi:hypothetical protein